jgi:hypothetical protein
MRKLLLSLVIASAMFSPTTPLRAQGGGDDDMTNNDVRLGAGVMVAFDYYCRPIGRHAQDMMFVIWASMTDPERTRLLTEVMLYLGYISTNTFCKINEPRIEKLEDPATTGLAVRLEYMRRLAR